MGKILVLNELSDPLEYGDPYQLAGSQSSNFCFLNMNKLTIIKSFRFYRQWFYLQHLQLSIVKRLRTIYDLF